MGLFSRKNKKNQVETYKDQTYLAMAQGKELDMVSIIKNEQQQEIENPFVESAPTVAQKSVAKRYGDKYIGVSGKQIASSIVVDVRSYKKGEIIKDDSLLDEEEQKDSEENASSFFDEIMKSLDEAEEEDFGIVSEEKEEEKLKPKKVKKISTKGKKKIDIDIISGDFGGADII